MKTLRTLNIVFACTAFVALSVVGVAAEVPTIVVGPGESYYVGNRGSEQGGNGAYVYDLRAGATLVVTNSGGSGSFRSE